jgi:transposase
MERDLLKGWIEQGKSLHEIAALTDRDPSTVGYWCKKHGLTPNGKTKHAPRGALTREQLEPLVEAGLTFREMAAAVDRSVATVRYWVKRYELEQPRRFRRQEVEKATQNGRTLRRRCRRHGETDYAIVGSEMRPRCKKCRSEAVARRRQRIKEDLAREKGGKCLICGYRRCLAALQFHHVDPEQKLFGIAHRGLTRGIDEVRKEVEKCVLLCANCHIEVETGIASLPE